MFAGLSHSLVAVSRSSNRRLIIMIILKDEDHDESLLRALTRVNEWL